MAAAGRPPTAGVVGAGHSAVTVTVVVARALERFAGGRRCVPIDVAGDSTVGAVLAALAEQFPGIADRALDERGEIRRHVNVFVDGESVKATGGLQTSVRDGAELAILPAVS